MIADLPRWTFASLAAAMTEVADTFPVYVEGNDERTDAFLEASHRAEARINGPFVQELSKGYFRVWVDVNVLLTSQGTLRDRYELHRIAGLYLHALTEAVEVWNYGSQPGDYDDDPTLLGCLLPRAGRNRSVSVFHFGQTEKTDQVRQSAVDATLEMHIEG